MHRRTSSSCPAARALVRVKTATPAPARILVIKLSSLGDFIQVLGSFQAIRDHHLGSQVVLLTTAAFVEPARRCGFFDEVWVDERPTWWRLDRWLHLRRRLRGGRFDRIYDLQRQDRTGWYFRLLTPDPPEWVGIVPGCSHRYIDPPEPLHIMQRHAQMLALAGIERVPPPDLSCLADDIRHLGVKPPFALLVPGSSPHRLMKRWPAKRYAELAQILAGESITPVLIGGTAEQKEIEAITARCPAAQPVTTTLGDIVGLARGALFAVGNDTGPIHMIAAAGCPVVVVFSAQSDPIRVKPPGPRVVIVQSPRLADLPVSDVLTAIGQVRGAPT